MSELADKVAIVTGGAAGIGAGIAGVMAREGASVVVSDLDGERAAETAARLGGRSIGVRHDVTDQPSCEAALTTAVEAFGRLDVLVNNAGVAQRMPLTEMERGDWDRTFDVNVAGVYMMSRAAIRRMLAQDDGGAIVNVASIDGKQGVPNYSHYSASKFAVIGFTQSLALEQARHGIRVNAVCPGVVATDLWRELLAERAAADGTTVEEVWRAVVESTPMGRPQDPEDIGEAVSFLASERAKNITGISLDVAGGKEMR